MRAVNGTLFKQGDLVVVKDGLGYNRLMQNLVGHVGIITEKASSQFSLAGKWMVLINGSCYKIYQSDLELVSEKR